MAGSRTGAPDRRAIWAVDLVVHLSAVRGGRLVRRQGDDSTTVEAADANAARRRAIAWVLKIYQEPHWCVDRVRVVTVRPLCTLLRCHECGEFRSDGRVLCSCSGLTCEGCGQRRIHRPTSDYYDEATRKLWHEPYFHCPRFCEQCEPAHLGTPPARPAGRATQPRARESGRDEPSE
jgi:hypothetical protein